MLVRELCGQKNYHMDRLCIWIVICTSQREHGDVVAEVDLVSKTGSNGYVAMPSPPRSFCKGVRCAPLGVYMYITRKHGKGDRSQQSGPSLHTLYHWQEFDSRHGALKQKWWLFLQQCLNTRTWQSNRLHPSLLSTPSGRAGIDTPLALQSLKSLSESLVLVLSLAFPCPTLYYRMASAVLNTCCKKHVNSQPQPQIAAINAILWLILGVQLVC